MDSNRTTTKCVRGIPDALFLCGRWASCWLCQDRCTEAGSRCSILRCCPVWQVITRFWLYFVAVDCDFNEAHYYPAPGRGTGYCFRAISFFVSLSATLRENGWTDLHKIFTEDMEWPWLNGDLIKFWVNSGTRSAGQRSICSLSLLSICLLSPAIAQRTDVNKSVSSARWQQLVIIIIVIIIIIIIIIVVVTFAAA